MVEVPTALGRLSLVRFAHNVTVTARVCLRIPGAARLTPRGGWRIDYMLDCNDENGTIKWWMGIQQFLKLKMLENKGVRERKRGEHIE